MGGKTGTGDHRFERYGKGGQLIDSRVISRSATFVFYLGDRYFGTMTAVVEGEQAGQFGYTSSLTAQMLKMLLPQLQPYLYPQPSKAAPTAVVEAKPTPAAPPVQRAPVKEEPDDVTSKADPLVKQPPAVQGGFPENLEPNVVLPVPVTPAAPAANSSSGAAAP